MGQGNGGGGPAGEQGGDGGEEQSQGGHAQVAIDWGEWGGEEGGEKAEGEEDGGGKIGEVEAGQSCQGAKVNLACGHFCLCLQVPTKLRAIKRSGLYLY